MSFRALSLAGALAVVIPGGSAPGADLGPLLDTLRTDRSFKVRLQAARILVRRAEAEPNPNRGAVVPALERSARSDDHPLVRAFAIRALGDLAGPGRGEPFEIARVDPDPFVREQAELAKATWIQRTEEAPVLVLSSDPWWDGDAEDRTAELEAALRRHARILAGGRYRVEPPGGSGRGLWLRASVAGVESRPEGDDEVVTLELKLALSTWPDKNLRQVVTARASARVRPSHSGLDRLRARLLDRAVKQALNDALTGSTEAE